MKKIIYLISSMIFLSSCTQQTDKSPPTLLHQQKKEVRVIEGKIRGYDTKELYFHAQEGQILHINMTTRSPMAYFNVYLPNTDEPIFNSAMRDEQFEGNVGKTGEYKILIYQMRASARRNQKVPYRLEIITH